MQYSFVYKPNDVICREGANSYDLFYLEEGRLLICTVHGTEVKALSRIEPGEFIGELSFFDGKPRTAFIIALERSVVMQIRKDEIMEHLPFWFVEIGKNLTKKIRLLNHIVQSSSVRKASSEEQKPLTIEEQRQILNAINKQ